MSVSLKSIANYGSSGKRGTGAHKKWTDQLRRNRKRPCSSCRKRRDARKRSRNDGREKEYVEMNTQRIVKSGNGFNMWLYIKICPANLILVLVNSI
jgi:hypothetical protein